MHALFDVLSLKTVPNNQDKVSIFERYVMGYLRIHTGTTVFSIALIWGRNDEHVG